MAEQGPARSRLAGSAIIARESSVLCRTIGARHVTRQRTPPGHGITSRPRQCRSFLLGLSLSEFSEIELYLPFRRGIALRDHTYVTQPLSVSCSNSFTVELSRGEQVE